MRNWVLGEHLFQVSLGCSRGCPAHPTAAQSHPTGCGQAARSKEGLASAQMQTRIIYKDRKSHLPSLSLFSLCREGYDFHRCSPSPDRLPGLTTTGQTKSAFPQQSGCRWVLKDWRSLSCAAWLWPTHSIQHAACPSFLPHHIPSSHKSPQEPAFLGCIFWSFSTLKRVPVMLYRAGTAGCRWLLLACQSPSHCSFQSCTGCITPAAMSSIWSLWLLGH